MDFGLLNTDLTNLTNCRNFGFWKAHALTQTVPASRQVKMEIFFFEVQRVKTRWKYKKIAIEMPSVRQRS